MLRPSKDWIILYIAAADEFPNVTPSSLRAVLLQAWVAMPRLVVAVAAVGSRLLSS